MVNRADATGTDIEMEFDVFLCHNSQDKPTVKGIAKELRRLGLRPWLDQEQLQPGLPWQRALEKQMAAIGAAAVFVGPDGLGPWQQVEQEAFLREFVKRGCPVIPVALEGLATPPNLPKMLEAMTWVDFRDAIPDPYEQLYFGVTGRKLHLSSNRNGTEDLRARRFYYATISVLCLTLFMLYPFVKFVPSDLLYVAGIAAVLGLALISIVMQIPPDIAAMHGRIFRQFRDLDECSVPDAVNNIHNLIARDRENVTRLAEGIVEGEYRLARRLLPF